MTQHQDLYSALGTAECILSDTDFVDNIVLLSNTVNQAQELLYRVESACNSVALYLNSPKTKYVAFSNDSHLIETISDPRHSDGGEPNLLG